MPRDEYVEERNIHMVKHKKDQGKLQRFVLNPIHSIISSDKKTEDSKKDRLMA